MRSRWNTYANRGRPLEDLMKIANERYKAAGRAAVHKVPTEFLPIRDARGEVVSCKVEEKSCVDFLGRYLTIPVAVEAKHTEEKRIRFDRVEPHQASFLDDWCRSPGGVGLVVVSFHMKRFFAVPWAFWKAARDVWAADGPRGASAPVSGYGWLWDTPGLASVASEELLPDWEIRMGGRYALPYLDIIERMAKGVHHGAE